MERINSMDNQLQLFLIEKCVNDISRDENKIVPWFLFGKYVKEKKKQNIFQDDNFTKLEQKITNEIGFLNHKFKEYLDFDENNKIVVLSYPDEIDELYDSVVFSWNKTNNEVLAKNE